MSQRAFLVALSVLAAVGCSRTPNSQTSAAAPGVSPQAQGGSPQAQAAYSEPAVPTFAIPAGAEVRVRLDQTVGTRYDRPGDRFRATLVSPIMVNGQTVVPPGTPFSGRVVVARRSGRLKGRAVLELSLDSFQLDGVTYPIETGPKVRASRSHKRRNLALIGGGGGIGAAIGAIAHGGAGALIGAGAGAAAGATAAVITGRKNVTLPAETPLLFSLRTEVEIRG